MGKRYKLEPTKDGTEKLYFGINDDEDVDDKPLRTTLTWLSKALRVGIPAVKNHIHNGHLGPTSMISTTKVLLLQGHRAVSRLNNDRHPKDGAITMTELIALRKLDTSMFNAEKYTMVSYYSHDVAKAMAEAAVDNEIVQNLKEKSNWSFHWWKYKKGTPEFEAAYKKRSDIYYNEYISQRYLVHKKHRITDGMDMVKRMELPPGIIATIDGRLTLAQASYFVTEWEDYVNRHPDDMQVPAIRFKVSQMVLEQIYIQELRDIQMLSNTDVSSTDRALSGSIIRLEKLTPPQFLKSPVAPKKPEGSPDNGESETTQQAEGDGTVIGGKGFDKEQL